MKLTRRELLQRMGILAASLPLARLPDMPVPNIPDDTEDIQAAIEISLVQSAVSMYFFYPSVKTGWICKECQGENTHLGRKCETCGIVETAIPETWTCPDCEETQVWESRCSCYNAVQGVKDNKINPFWLG